MGALGTDDSEGSFHKSWINVLTKASSEPVPLVLREHMEAKSLQRSRVWLSPESRHLSGICWLPELGIRNICVCKFPSQRYFATVAELYENRTLGQQVHGSVGLGPGWFQFMSQVCLLLGQVFLRRGQIIESWCPAGWSHTTCDTQAIIVCLPRPR